MENVAPQVFIDELRQLLRTRYPVHPLRHLLLNGGLTKAQLQGWAKNQFYEFSHIHRFFGIRYQKCPVRALRRMLLENMVEEEGEDLFGGKYPSHAELWMQFGEGLGVVREEMLAYVPLPGVRAALEMYVQLVQRSHWAVAIGTGLVFEGEGPRRMGEERQALEMHYPWISVDSLDFFRAHEYHDEGHGDFVADVIKEHVIGNGLQDEMRAAVNERVDTMWLQNESIFQAFVRPALSPDATGEFEVATP